MNLNERVGEIELIQARQGEQLGQLRGDVRGVQEGINRLLDRDQKRPAAMTPASIATACGGLAATGAVVWWLIQSSPAVQEIDKRLTRLDDPEIGRVSRIERDIGWSTKITRAK
ncbi:MAG: hypothetical protein ABL897_10610 [Hyphomicrobium sp.]